MAPSPPLTSAFLLLLLIAAVIPPAIPQRCKSQTFSPTDTKFTNCTDLPTLNATLHWTYAAAAKPGPVLSIAFIAPPARPDGWVAWALNPTGSGMVGAQALLAFRDADGSAAVKTYNISSYGPIAESEIAYAVSRRRAELSGADIRLFATLALPAGAAAAINQVWQVGSSVKGGVPARHDFSPENLNSVGSLSLEAAESGGAAAPESVGVTPSIPRGNSLRGGGRRRNGSGSIFGVHGVLVLLLGYFLAF